MQTNLGRCHFGGDDAATMIGVRPAGCGWIGVCSRHSNQAEQDGYVLHELVVDDDRGRGGQPEPHRQVAAAADGERDEPYEPYEPSVGLDILDEPYPEPAGGQPLR